MHGSGGIGPYDLAVLTLKRSFALIDYQKAILKNCPPLEFVRELYKNGTVIGLGLIKQFPEAELAKQLIEANLRVNRKCGFYEYYGLHIDHAFQVCYSLPGRAGICGGDSGRPLVFKKNGRAECFIGVTSFSTKICNLRQFPSVFIHAGSFTDWITSQLRVSHLTNSDSKNV